MMTRRTFWIPLTAFAVTLAILLGQRLSTDALAVLFGLAIGIAAGLPGQVMLFALMRQARTPPPASEPAALPRPAPRQALPVPRSFIIVGDE